MSFLCSPRSRTQQLLVAQKLVQAPDPNNPSSSHKLETQAKPTALHSNPIQARSLDTMKFFVATSPSTLALATLATISAILLPGAQASTCTVHVYPRKGVYPQPGSFNRLSTFNGGDEVCIFDYKWYEMKTEQWNDLECAGNQVSCKLSNWYGCDSVVANLPCNSYYIQYEAKKFCEAALDPRTNQPYTSGPGLGLCKSNVIVIPPPGSPKN